MEESQQKQQSPLAPRKKFRPREESCNVGDEDETHDLDFRIWGRLNRTLLLQVVTSFLPHEEKIEIYHMLLMGETLRAKLIHLYFSVQRFGAYGRIVDQNDCYLQKQWNLLRQFEEADEKDEEEGEKKQHKFHYVIHKLGALQSYSVSNGFDANLRQLLHGQVLPTVLEKLAQNPTAERSGSRKIFLHNRHWVCELDKTTCFPKPKLEAEEVLHSLLGRFDDGFWDGNGSFIRRYFPLETANYSYSTCKITYSEEQIFPYCFSSDQNLRFYFPARKRKDFTYFFFATPKSIWELISIIITVQGLEYNVNDFERICALAVLAYGLEEGLCNLILTWILSQRYRFMLGSLTSIFAVQRNHWYHVCNTLKGLLTQRAYARENVFNSFACFHEAKNLMGVQ